MGWPLRLLLLSPLAIFLGTVALFFWGLGPERDPSAVPSALVQQAAPEVELPPVAGLGVPGFTTADLKSDEGRVTLVNFFASWCLPCRAEHPLLTRLAEEPRVRLFGVNYKDKAEEARAWLLQLGNPYARIGADSGRGGIAWGITGVPETFVVGPAGSVCYHHAGPVSAPELEKKLRPAIEACR